MTTASRAPKLCSVGKNSLMRFIGHVLAVVVFTGIVGVRVGVCDEKV